MLFSELLRNHFELEHYSGSLETLEKRKFLNIFENLERDWALVPGLLLFLIVFLKGLGSRKKIKL